MHDCLSKHLERSAVFYADKLVTLSGSNPGDVYLLAQVGEDLRFAYEGLGREIMSHSGIFVLDSMELNAGGVFMVCSLFAVDLLYSSAQDFHMFVRDYGQANRI